MDGVVRQEATGWRDLSLSQRHRTWGYHCPAVDIDFLLIEYDKAEPIALVEYKRINSTVMPYTHPCYLALIKLANRAGIPFFDVRYDKEFTKWVVRPLNILAHQKIQEEDLATGEVEMTEREYVSLLYRLRGREMPQNLLETSDEYRRQQRKEGSGSGERRSGANASRAGN